MPRRMKGGKTGTTTPVGSFRIQVAASKMSAKAPSQALSNLVRDSQAGIEVAVKGFEEQKGFSQNQEDDPQISSSSSSSAPKLNDQINEPSPIKRERSSSMLLRNNSSVIGLSFGASKTND